MLIVFNNVLAFSAEQAHPRLFVTDAEKDLIWEKINNYDWAKQTWLGLLSATEEYVDRHTHDPMWMISRMQMYWTHPHYITADVNRNTYQLYNFTGDAPYPTVRIQTSVRTKFAPDGYLYEAPGLNDIEPVWNTDGLLRAKSTNPTATNWYDGVDIGGEIKSINEDILNKAMCAAFIYWMTGEEKYAIFASDIFVIFGKAFSQHEMLGNWIHAGFVGAVTLMDSKYINNMAVLYDFIRPYLKSVNGERVLSLTTPDGKTWDYAIADSAAFQTMFKKMAHTMVERGNPGSNWDLVNSLSLLLSALLLDDPDDRAHYVKYFRSVDGPRQSSLPTMLQHYTDDGMIEEPPGYHAYPLGFLLKGATVFDFNGGDGFATYPKIYRSTYALDYQTAQNGKACGYGNHKVRMTLGRSTTIPMEYALSAAQRNGDTSYFNEMKNRMADRISKGWYSRSQQPANIDGIMLLARALPTVSATGEGGREPLPRVYKADYAQLVVQRNGDDKKYGLFAYTVGSDFTHAHANGIHMELYGMGYFLGVDAGAGTTYETLEHSGYYIQYAAHNTIVINGRSSGGDGNMWSIKSPKIENIVQEPGHREPALSDNISFNISRFDGEYDRKNRTTAVQERLLSIVRTSEESGYYVDIFRSRANDVNGKHEYIYHNFGDSVTFIKHDGTELPLTPIADHVVQGDLDDWQGGATSGPGYRGPDGRGGGKQYFTSRKKSSVFTEDVTALFKVNDLPEESLPIYMKAHILGSSNRTYFTANTLPSHVAPDPYHNRLTPSMVIRKTGEAWDQPFVVVYEPFAGNLESIDSVTSFNADDGDNGDFIGLTIRNTDINSELAGGVQHIMHSTDTAHRYINSERGISFQGRYGVIRKRNNALQEIYLGSGKYAAVGDELICESMTGEDIHVSAVMRNGRVFVSSSGKVKVSMRYTNYDSAISYAMLGLFYRSGNTTDQATDSGNRPDSGTVDIGGGVVWGTLPAGRDMEILVSTNESLYNPVRSVADPEPVRFPDRHIPLQLQLVNDDDGTVLEWEQVEGPYPAYLIGADTAEATAVVELPGFYRFRVTATRGEWVTTREVEAWAYAHRPSSAVLTAHSATFVRDGTYANDAYGAATELSVKQDGSSYSRQVFVRFVLPDLDSPILMATLTMTPTSMGMAGMEHVVHGVAATGWERRR